MPLDYFFLGEIRWVKLKGRGTTWSLEYTEVGIYKRKQENKIKRKENTLSTKKAIKKTTKKKKNAFSLKNINHFIFNHI